jgi:hypothetical protein
MAWIRDRIDPDAPEATHIVLGIDRSGGPAEPGQHAVSLLLARGMESEEGVFYLLPQDLCCEASRSGDVVTVDLLTVPEVSGDDDGSVEWVRILSAAIPHPETAVLPGMPILLIECEGVVGLDELLESIPEAGLFIVGPKPKPKPET